MEMVLFAGGEEKGNGRGPEESRAWVCFMITVIILEYCHTRFCIVCKMAMQLDLNFMAAQSQSSLYVVTQYFGLQ